MASRLLIHLLLVIGLAGTGCTAIRSASGPHDAHDQINDKLLGRSAVLVLRDGQRLDHVRSVRLGPETTEYVRRGSYLTRRIATSEISQVYIRIRKGAWKSAAVGAVPGILVLLAGAAWASTADSSGEAYFGEGLGAVLTILGGASAAVVGAGIGGVIGRIESDGELILVYEAPAKFDHSE